MKKKKGLSKIVGGGKVRRGENDVFLSPSKGHQARNLSRATKLGTFHWPLNIGTF